MRQKYAFMGITVILTMVLWTNTLSEKKKVSYTPDSVVMKVGDCQITVSEAMIYMLERRKEIESAWGSEMWSAEIGTDEKGNKVTYEDEVKDDVAEWIEIQKVLVQEAKEQAIKLSKKERVECRKQAKKEIGMFDSKELITYEITLDKVSSYYKEKKIASKMYNKILEDFEADYDLADYKMMTVYEMVFPTVQSNKEGELVEVSETEDRKQKQRADEARKKVVSGEKLDTVARYYGLKNAGEKTLNASEVFGNLWDEVNQLEDGECSSVMETDNGYMIVQMIHKNDRKKQEEAINQEVEKQKKEWFQKKYKEDYKNHYKTKMEEDVWKKLPLASQKDES